MIIPSPQKTQNMHPYILVSNSISGTNRKGPKFFLNSKGLWTWSIFELRQVRKRQEKMEREEKDERKEKERHSLLLYAILT